MRRVLSGSRSARRGSALIEFVFVALTLFMVVFASIEFNRMMIVYTAVANSARAGVRYAITHGNDRTGSGTNGPSGPGSVTEVQNVVRAFAGASLLDTSQLTINVTYPDARNWPGDRVRVVVGYPYDPFAWAPIASMLSVMLSNESYGYITY